MHAALLLEKFLHGETKVCLKHGVVFKMSGWGCGADFPVLFSIDTEEPFTLAGYVLCLLLRAREADHSLGNDTRGNVHLLLNFL